MNTQFTERPMVTGPITVPLGRHIVTDKRDYYPFPRQAFPINRALLAASGYGEAAIESLINGHWIITSDIPLTGPDRSILEFPDGSRYATALEFLGGETVVINIIERLLDAPR